MKHKIIIWGYPIHSHTHSYIHEAFYKAFKHMGYDVYWFHDGDFPFDFNFNDCIFWTEGFADNNIPLNSTSTYFVHVCPSPKKYLDAGVKKFIDVRYNHIWHKDHVYEYTLDKSNVEKIGPGCYLEKKKIGENIHVINDYHNYEISDYDKLYITWATNLLPDEFNIDDVKYPRENAIYFCGNISPAGRCENTSTFTPFINESRQNGIPFHINDPFANPLPNEEVVRRTKNSILGVDVRGPEHLRNGYVPCRVFKSISWGHLGMTNSPEVFKELEGNCILEEDTARLFHVAMEKKKDLDFIRKSMMYVKENHTYINRIKSIMSII
jgi:hypothetical protein